MFTWTLGSFFGDKKFVKTRRQPSRDKRPVWSRVQADITLSCSQNKHVKTIKTSTLSKFFGHLREWNFLPLPILQFFFQVGAVFTLDVLVNISTAILSSHQQSLNNQHASNLFFEKGQAKKDYVLRSLKNIDVFKNRHGHQS